MMTIVFFGALIALALSLGTALVLVLILLLTERQISWLPKPFGIAVRAMQENYIHSLPWYQEEERRRKEEEEALQKAAEAAII